jgi:hypothetical protein
MVAAGGGHVAGAAVGGGPSAAVWRRAVVMKVSGENGGKNIHLAKWFYGWLPVANPQPTVGVHDWQLT